jgi:hypothetical protein
MKVIKVQEDDNPWEKWFEIPGSKKKGKTAPAPKKKIPKKKKIPTNEEEENQEEENQ